MFGALGRSAHGTGPHRTRRRTVLIVVAGLVLALVIGEITDQVVNSQAPANLRAGRTWVAAVIPIIGESDRLGLLVRQVRQAPAGLPATNQAKLRLEALLNEIETVAVTDRIEFENLGLVAPSQRSLDALSGVLTTRLKGANTLAGAIGLATGLGRNAASLARAATLLADAGSEMVSADRQYRQFASSLAPNLGRERLPSTQWISSPAAWTPVAASNWVGALSSDRFLDTHRTLSIVAISLQPAAVTLTNLPNVPTTTTFPTTTTTLPLATGATGATGVTTTTLASPTTTTFPTTTTLQIPPPPSISHLPATSSISVIVVVANSGTSSIAKVTVAASLVANGAIAKTKSISRGASSTSRTAGDLSPGGSRYLVLAPLGAVPGGSYELQVTVSGTGAIPATGRVALAVG